METICEGEMEGSVWEVEVEWRSEMKWVGECEVEVDGAARCIRSGG